MKIKMSTLLWIVTLLAVTFAMVGLGWRERNETLRQVEKERNRLSYLDKEYKSQNLSLTEKLIARDSHGSRIDPSGNRFHKLSNGYVYILDRNMLTATTRSALQQEWSGGALIPDHASRVNICWAVNQVTSRAPDPASIPKASTHRFAFELNSKVETLNSADRSNSPFSEVLFNLRMAPRQTSNGRELFIETTLWESGPEETFDPPRTQGRSIALNDAEADWLFDDAQSEKAVEMKTVYPPAADLILSIPAPNESQELIFIRPKSPLDDQPACGLLIWLELDQEAPTSGDSL